MADGTDNKEWWKKTSVEELAEAAQERHDAGKLIKIGNITGDKLTKSIGQARLRVVEGRGTPEDFELLGKINPD